MDLRSSFDSLNLGDSESNDEGLWGHLSLRPDGRYVRLDSETDEEISKEPPVGQMLVVKKEGGGVAYTSDPPAAVFQEPEDSGINSSCMKLNTFLVWGHTSLEKFTPKLYGI